jgi:hypothetical protein
MVFACKLWLGSRHCSLGIFRDQAVFASEGSLFWIQIVFMLAISVRFARGASKLRSFLNLVNTEEPESKEANCQRISNDHQGRERAGPP